MKKIITILSLILFPALLAQETDSLTTTPTPADTTVESNQLNPDSVAQAPGVQPVVVQPKFAPLKITDPKELRLEKIYRNLEYNTTAFNDLKKTWVVTDPVYVRELYNRFVVKNALAIQGIKPSLETLQAKSRDIYDGNVFVELRKRYYDDEIEILRFFTESKLASQD
ncbi:MAG: hypothetical protein Q8N83_03880, partial [Ignavibacteria bacterium]|nr:hypothetical protein [Ignavibacteria bacterium]